MNGRVLLDTNINMALWASEVAVTEQLARASEVFVPVIALGELYYGARKSAWSTNDIELNLGVEVFPPSWTTWASLAPSTPSTARHSLPRDFE